MDGAKCGVETKGWLKTHVPGQHVSLSVWWALALAEPPLDTAPVLGTVGRYEGSSRDILLHEGVLFDHGL